MVRVDSAIKGLSKPSVQTDPPDLFTDFPSFLDESFPDFDSIEGWMLDQDFEIMPTDETLSGGTDAFRKLVFPETDEFVEEQSEVEPVREYCLETSAGPNEAAQVTTLGASNGLTASGMPIDTIGAGGTQVGSPVEQELRGNIGLSGDSIAEEMEKVRLVANSAGTFVNSGTKCEETSMEDVGLSQMAVTGNVEASPRNGGECTSTFDADTVCIDTKVGSETNIDTLKLENVNEGSDSGTSNSDSAEESSSSSSSDETDDDDEEEEDSSPDDDVEVEEGEIKFAEEAVIGSDDEEEAVIRGPVKSKNEVEILPSVPAVTVVLEPHHQTLPVGVILSIVGAKVIVEGLEKHNPLNESSILWITETRLPLGMVDEIFGPVKNPYYVVRYNSEEDVPSGIHEGTPISFVVDFANHVLNDKNLYQKGYDASGENDEEISDELEFSDDEKEAEFKRSKRTAKRGKADKKHGNQGTEARKRAQAKNEHWTDFQPAKNEVWKDFQPSKNEFRKDFQPSKYESRKDFQPAKNEFRKDFQPAKNEFRKDSQPDVTPAPVGIVNPEKADVEIPFTPGQPQIPPAPAYFGSASCGFPHGAQTVVPFGGPHQALQLGGLWPNMVPTQAISLGPPPNAIPFHGLPLPQLHHHHPDQHQHQIFTGFQNVPPFQQQYDPRVHGMAAFGSMNLPMGLPSMNWPGPFGPDNVSQRPTMPGFNAQLQTQALQGGFSATEQHSQCTPPVLGNRPFRRGRGGHQFRGRGRRQIG